MLFAILRFRCSSNSWFVFGHSSLGWFRHLSSDVGNFFFGRPKKKVYPPKLLSSIRANYPAFCEGSFPSSILSWHPCKLFSGQCEYSPDSTQFYWCVARGSQIITDPRRLPFKVYKVRTFANNTSSFANDSGRTHPLTFVIRLLQSRAMIFGPRSLASRTKMLSICSHSTVGRNIAATCVVSFHFCSNPFPRFSFNS